MLELVLRYLHVTHFSFFPAPLLFGTLAVTQVFAWWGYNRWKQGLYRGRIEERAAALALEPMMLAERDR